MLWNTQLTTVVKVSVTTAASNQVANLVVDDLHGGIVDGAEAGASAVDSERGGAGDEEDDGGELHIDVLEIVISIVCEMCGCCVLQDG